MKDILNECRLCPRNCSVNRNCGEVGYCNAGDKITIAKYYLHKWEEPCITGDNGSGTIFFTYCNLFLGQTLMQMPHTLPLPIS